MTDAPGIGGELSSSDGTVVTAHSSAPHRTVLTERGNTDAWIASDLAVELPR